MKICEFIPIRRDASIATNRHYVPIIGLEVHVELKTESKMFCGCTASYFGHEPNIHCCPVCLGLPGALPVPNKKAIDWCLFIGLALDCQIPKISKFDRKNYFYPDLPKGYQISQYDNPLCINGHLGEIEIRRVHMEEDTAKLIHTDRGTLIDFNRSGVPLAEIVTEPDIHSAQEARIFLQKLAQVVQYLGVSDCDMEKGTMRLEPNISLQKTGERGLPPYKVEIKNINSFRFVEKAIEYEIQRQISLLEEGEIVRQETRRFDPQKGITLPQRGKEEAQDYRYFPEPDIPPMRWTEKQVSDIRSQIPELPEAKLARFMREYSLSEYDVNILTTSLPVASYFEEAVKVGKEHALAPKQIANVLINRKIDIENILPAELIKMILQKAAPSAMSQEELGKIVKKVILDNPKAVSDYKSGKEQAIMFLVGQVVKETKGKADASAIKSLIEKELS